MKATSILQRLHSSLTLSGLMITAGAAACAWSLAQVVTQPLKLDWLALSLLTILAGSRVVTRLPRQLGKITVSDVFILFSLLYYGIAPATVLAVMDGFYAPSEDASSEKRMRYFNAAIRGTIVFSAGWLGRFLFNGTEIAASSSLEAILILLLIVVAIAAAEPDTTQSSLASTFQTSPLVSEALQAATDPLTGLPNATSLAMSFTNEVHRADRYGYPLMLLALDLDHFKRFNDTYGHETGDRLLRDLAKRLHAELRRGDVLTRYAGDEFVALLHRMTPDLVNDLIVRLEAALEAWQFEINETQRVNIEASMGYALYGEDGRTLPELMQAADQRLRRCRAARQMRNEAQAIGNLRFFPGVRREFTG